MFQVVVRGEGNKVVTRSINLVSINRQLSVTFVAFALFSWLTWIPLQVDAAERRSKFNDVQRSIGSRVITCREGRNGFIPGSGKGRRFKAFTYQIRELRKLVRVADRKQRKKLSTRLNLLRQLAREAGPICGAVGANPTTPDTDPPAATPIPVQYSYDPLSRPMTEDDVRYLLGKAGYGYNPRKHNYLFELAAAGGVNAVVDDLLAAKPEPQGLEARLFERLDDNLEAGTTTRTNYTLRGMREAAVELAINTNNQVLTRLGWEIFFGKWTASDRVLTNRRQYEVFWQYRKLLDEFAFNPSTTLRDVLVEISKHPMMLWFLDNGSSTAGNPNENYAREIQELYSMGPDRWNDTCTEKVRNYYEEYDGFRQLGDIFQATLALTGWLVTDREIDGQRYYRAAFSEEDHRPGEKTLYRGTAFERKVSRMEEVVDAILTHPGTAQGLATDLLKAYVTSEPTCPMILEFARIIRAQNYNLRAAVATLLKSNIFYNPEFRNKIIKSPLHRTAQFVNALALTYGDENLTRPEEIGVDIGDIVNHLDSQGMLVNSPATVFYYDEAAFFSTLGYADQVNLFLKIASYWWLIVKLNGMGSENDRQFFNWWRPGGEVLARDMVLFAAKRLNVSLTEDQVTQLEYFLNNSRNSGGQMFRTVYDNQGSTSKLIRLYVILASLPGYFTS